MYQIVLTGGIGAGKTAVANRFAEHGAHVIDYDQLARDVVEVGQPALEEIRKRWGSVVMHKDGTLNRGALADVVFASRADLEMLNSITHPRIQELAAKRAAAIVKSDSRGVLVHDIPLVTADSPLVMHGDLVVVVEAPLEARIDRLASTRGMTVEEARARIAQQSDDAEREQLADVVIYNDGSLAKLHHSVDECWAKAIGDWEADA